jgi:hypothetical protein
MIKKIGEAIKVFAKFNRCVEIIVKKSNDKILVKKILAASS